MHCEVNAIRGAYVWEGSEYLLELRPINDHMVLSDVIASRAYNDIESIHIMLLTESSCNVTFIQKTIGQNYSEHFTICQIMIFTYNYGFEGELHYYRLDRVKHAL